MAKKDEDIYKKGGRLCLAGKVSRSGKRSFLVEGDHGDYHVTLNGKRMSCECRAGSVGNGICSHQVAAILYLFFQNEWLVDVVGFLKEDNVWSNADCVSALKECVEVWR